MQTKQKSLLASTLTILLAVLGVLSQQAVAADAAGALTSKPNAAFGFGIPINDPTYCFGENDQGQCVLYFGSANSCNNVIPCTNNTRDTDVIKKAVAEVVVGHDDLTFCYGLDNDTDQCKLFLGSKESCDNVQPCSVGFKQLSKQLSR